MGKCGRAWSTGFADNPCKTPSACSACHKPIKAREVSFAPAPSRHPGPAPARPQEYGKNRHVPLALLERMGPCPIARTMAAIGNPWSFLILQEYVYGVRRFNNFAAISPSRRIS